MSTGSQRRWGKAAQQLTAHKAAGSSVDVVPAMSEATFQTRVIDTCRTLGIRVAHFRAAQTAHGWRTPMQGQAGFPDLVLAHGGRVLLVELKSDRGRIAAAQHEWLSELGAHAVVWRPRDWHECVLPTLRSRLATVERPQR